MFELIAYIFKIFIAIIIGYALSYNNEENKTFNQYSSLSCFFTASTTGILILLEDFNLLLVGLVFLAINYYIIRVIDIFTVEEKYKVLFSSINGLIIGLGYVFSSILITLIFIYIVNNFDIIYQLMHNDKKVSNKESVSQSDDSKNDLELIEEDS